MRINTKAASWQVSCAIVLATLLSVSAGQATAQSRVPNEEELHSMCCVGVLRTQITLQEHMIPAIDSSALAAAVRQANAELPASWSNEALLRQMNACENPTWVAR